MSDDHANRDPRERLNSHAQQDAGELHLRFDDSPAPDLTRQIMGQLGYMRVGPRVARRYRIQRWAGRVGILASAALAIGVGLRVFESSDLVRRPAEITLPAAIGNDVQRQQHRIGTMIETIRNLTLPTAPSYVPEAMPPRGDEIPEQIDDDIELPMCAPFQWV